MKIAVDAMGGDFGPRVTVAGALRAAQDFGIDVFLVGAERVIKKEVEKVPRARTKCTIVDAPEAVGMGEGIFSLRRKTKSSIRVGAQLVKDRLADGFVSTGNTAAVVYISRKVIGALQGVERPALALLVPTIRGLSLLIDVGASVDCRPEHLEQFAVMGRVFMKSVLGLENPRIGLMSIGEEESKGNDLTREAYERLENSPLHFIGNVEGKDIYSGKADVIVCDGFTGNVALKVSEGVVEALFHWARREVTKNLLAKLGVFLMKRNLKRLYKKVDYSEYGGAQLLGINGVCIIGHGRSNPQAIKSAVRMARDFVVHRVQERIQAEIAKLGGATHGAKA